MICPLNIVDLAGFPLFLERTLITSTHLLTNLSDFRV